LIGRISGLPHPPSGTNDGLLISGGVKMFMDGSGGARTAWMYEDWNKNFTEKDAGNAGYPVTPPDEYRDSVKLLHDAGFHVSTHAIGDRAIDWVVDTYEQALAANPKRGMRHGIIHANTPTDHAIEVMARLQRDYDAGFPEAQATFLWWLGDNYAANLGPQRSTTTIFRLMRIVDDRIIPGTLNAGHTLPTIAQALIYTSIITVDIMTLFSMIAASVLGARGLAPASLRAGRNAKCKPGWASHF
jgi:hypothetical protein